MLSRIFSIPFVIAAIYFLYLTWEVDESYSRYIVPCVISLALVYVFSPQLDWWWYKRYPPKMDGVVRAFFQKNYTFFQNLSLENKQRFRDRVGLFIHAKDFKPQGADSVPEDIKAIIAANAVHLTFGLDDFLLNKFEHIVVYPKPFPSPAFPKHFHASETFEEDGVTLFAAEPLLKSFVQPKQYYNIGLHEFAQVFILSHPNQLWPRLEDDIWEKLEHISGFSKEVIHQWINLEEIDSLAVSIVIFLVFPQPFKVQLPKIFQTFSNIFQLNPLEENDPVLK